MHVCILKKSKWLQQKWGRDQIAQTSTKFRSLSIIGPLNLQRKYRLSHWPYSKQQLGAVRQAMVFVKHLWLTWIITFVCDCVVLIKWRQNPWCTLRCRTWLAVDPREDCLRIEQLDSLLGGQFPSRVNDIPLGDLQKNHARFRSLGYLIRTRLCVWSNHVFMLNASEPVYTSVWSNRVCWVSYGSSADSVESTW